MQPFSGPIWRPSRKIAPQGSCVNSSRVDVADASQSARSLAEPPHARRLDAATTASSPSQTRHGLEGLTTFSRFRYAARVLSDPVQNFAAAGHRIECACSIVVLRPLFCRGCVRGVCSDEAWKCCTHSRERASDCARHGIDADQLWRLFITSFDSQA